MGQDHGTTRKGPWTEHEDFQLVFHVHMFGDRRWDFIAGVSGLKRTGKSCRLRWVNYLNPGLKRGKLAPHEERLVLELHSKFGNRWSKIARKLPGRTDNEIKNYWRTHMRKRAQEKKRITSRSRSPSLSHCSSSSSTCTNSHPTVDSMPMTETNERNFYDTGGVDMFTLMEHKNNNKISDFSMDEIWKDIIDISDDDGNNSIMKKPFLDPYNSTERAPLTWDICMSTLWMTDGQEEFTNNTFHDLPTKQIFTSGLVD